MKIRRIGYWVKSTILFFLFPGGTALGLALVMLFCTLIGLVYLGWLK